MNAALILVLALTPEYKISEDQVLGELSEPVASENAESTESTTSEEVPDSKEPDPYKSYWGGIFRATDHTWRADLGYGLYNWDRVSDYESLRILRARLAYRFHPMIGAELGADYTWRSNQFGPLKVSNAMLGIGAHSGLEYWTGALRLSAMAGGGALIRTSEISDEASNSYDQSDVQPFGSVRGGVGTVISELVFFGLDADIRLRPAALDWNLVLSTGVVW